MKSAIQKAIRRIKHEMHYASLAWNVAKSVENYDYYSRDKTRWQRMMDIAERSTVDWESKEGNEGDPKAR